MDIDIFEPETTYLCDYQPYKLAKSRDEVCKPPEQVDQKKARGKQDPYLVDIQTLTRRNKDINIPFYLYWTPKPIVRTSPYDTFEKKEIPDFYEEIPRSLRPRVVLPGAVSIDDASELLGGDEESVQHLKRYMYSTSSHRASEEVATRMNPRPNCFNTTLDTTANKVTFKEAVDLGRKSCKEEASKWDDHQTRFYSDSTRHFWCKHAPYTCYENTRKNLEDLIDPKITERAVSWSKEGKLRLAYDIPVARYAGYMPNYPKGLGPPFEKFAQDSATPPTKSMNAMDEVQMVVDSSTRKANEVPVGLEVASKLCVNKNDDNIRLGKNWDCQHPNNVENSHSKKC